MKLSKKTQIAFVVFLFIIFSAGYIPARKAKWIVHRAGYYTDTDGTMKVAGHYLSHGDFGVPIFMPIGSAIQYLAVMLYWPHRQIEKLYWEKQIPQGTPWPPNWKLRISNNLMNRTK